MLTHRIRLSRARVATRMGAICLALIGVAPLLGGPSRFERAVRVRRVPIVNPGFETTSRAMVPFEVTSGARGLADPVGTYIFNGAQIVSIDHPVGVDGWRTFAPADPNVLIYAGVLRPGVVGKGSAFLVGMSGDHVAASRVSPMAQTLEEVVRPSTTYLLRFSAGYGLDEFASGVYVSMLAAPDRDAFVFQVGQPGVVFLANTFTSSSIIPPPAGLMRSYTVSFTTPDVLPPELVGKYLVISLVGSDGLPSMCFDDFELLAY